MKRFLFIALICSVFLTSCMKGEHVDLIIHNAQVHTMDDKLSIHEAIAIRDGKIVESNYYIHFPIPMQNAWDNVIYTCSTMLLFENENGQESKE